MTVSVSEYLGLLQEAIAPLKAEVLGEIGQITIRGKAVYFSLRDMKDGSVLSCLIWLSNYQMLGLDLKEGIEVLVSGTPEIYKPMGRLTFKASAIELVGEGELKKAYEKLKVKLEVEGVFDLSRKKELKNYPSKIGLITSREGAVIHDFLNNLGRYGFKIEFINSRVEGAQAVGDLISGIRTFKKKNLDALVIIRGGGSLESFIPFNNEAVIREILDATFPVIAGIGHDKDVPLLSLAADIMTSTPTAVTALLNESWKKADFELMLHTHQFQNELSKIVRETKEGFILFSRDFKRFGEELFQEVDQQFKNFNLIFSSNDPIRQLKRGFSIVRSKGKIISSASLLKKNDLIKIQFGKGNAEGKII